MVAVKHDLTERGVRHSELDTMMRALLAHLGKKQVSWVWVQDFIIRWQQKQQMVHLTKFLSSCGDLLDPINARSMALFGPSLYRWTF